MRKKPVLVIMAAGMGSRYGGLKQIDPIGPCGEIIIDYSLYDAKRAGFDTAICIIKHSIEEDFKRVMARGAAKHMNILYAYQDINDIPEGFAVPQGREKPWGTGHAILAARDLIDSPFAVINADDYYGSGVFRTVYDYLEKAEDGGLYDYCMAGYRIENTLTENGEVTRGVCTAKGEYLARIEETAGIARVNGRVCANENGSLRAIPDGTPVSMNLFGFTPSIIKELKERFPAALEEILKTNPLKGEFYIPQVASSLIEEGKAGIRILPASDRWYGVTYKEDKPCVAGAMKKKAEDGEYPERLWE